MKRRLRFALLLIERVRVLWKAALLSLNGRRVFNVEATKKRRRRRVDGVSIMERSNAESIIRRFQSRADLSRSPSVRQPLLIVPASSKFPVAL